MTKFKVSVYKTFEKDNYKDGIVYSDNDFDNHLEEQCIFGTLEKATEFIKEYAGEVYLIEDRIECQIQENVDGLKADDKELQDFKDGLIDLYVATYFFYITRIETHSFDHGDLLDAFPGIVEN